MAPDGNPRFSSCCQTAGRSRLEATKKIHEGANSFAWFTANRAKAIIHCDVPSLSSASCKDMVPLRELSCLSSILRGENIGAFLGGDPPTTSSQIFSIIDMLSGAKACSCFRICDERFCCTSTQYRSRQISPH